MTASFNSNLPTFNGDVIVDPQNPVNPDSKLMAAKRIISIEDDRGRICIVLAFLKLLLHYD
jgi:hypothetical protein